MKKSKRLHIMHVVDKLSMDGQNPSSCTILLKDWIASTDPSAFRFSVCSFRNPDPAGKILEAQGIEVHYLGYGKFSLKNTSEIYRLIKQGKIDLVHLHGYGAANFGRIASRKAGIPNVVHEHAVLKVLPHQYIADFLLRNYTGLAVAVSDGVKDFMIKGRSIPRSKVRVLENGIRLDKFFRYGDSENKKMRLGLGVPSSAQIVGTITRLRAEKGNAIFIEAMPEIIAACPNIFFLIVGEGPLREELESLASDLNLSKHLTFLGFRSDISAILSVLDVNVIPSLSEGFPLSLVESMAVGNAIVATQVGGMRRMIQDNETGLFISPNDARDLSEKVIFLLKNPKEATQLAEAAKKASQCFGIEPCVDVLTRLYRDLISETPQ